jgi:hypothetical protein
MLNLAEATGLRATVFGLAFVGDLTPFFTCCLAAMVVTTQVAAELALILNALNKVKRGGFRGALGRRLAIPEL